ncbi:DUF305 domain-containing protein [Streptomyces sp. NPDC001351]|uniref:DUF305 domain-containing protein n=1 Tax=Streptomyces sp. NPDC001351 TaxID=3364564 RepID=UPI0036BBA12E
MSATPRTLTRRAALIAATATAALVLSACGGSNDSGSAASSGTSASSSTGADTTADTYNAEDVAFAQGMIPHHQQAVQMARLAADRASSAQVKELAARIEKAQDPEITTMSGWLKSWGKDMPMSGSSMSSMPGMGQSGMPGMMSGAHMAGLKKLSGKEFDTMFLTMMIEHHKGAVEMATTEKNKGKYGAATSLADSIITTQNAEITQMNKMLGKG